MADGEVRVEITGDSSELNQALKNAERATEQTAESIDKIDEAAQRSIDSAVDLGTAIQGNLGEAADNAEDIVREVRNLGDAIDNAGNSTVTFGDLLKANILSDYIRGGINQLADAFGSFVKKGVDLASDLQEVQNVVDTTFGDGANQIYAWADAAAESFGMSSLSAQQYNGTMGAMLKSMGLADDAVIKMSTDMVGLAGDMASFYNLDIEQAFEKIRAGISGETEPLKQLGINMSVANLEAYALSQGIETAYDKMSQSEQAILRYNYLMSVTADAQGDFAKTSDSFANQQRILKLQVENLSASLGEKLLPHLNDVVGTVNEKLPQAERTIENIGEILGVATSFALEHHEAIISLVTAYGTFYGVMKAGTAIQTTVTNIKKLTDAIKAAEIAQNGMNAAAAANPYTLLAIGIAAVSGAVIKYVYNCNEAKRATDEIRESVEQAEQATQDNIRTTETEILKIQQKAKIYEELRQKENLTAIEEYQLKKIAEELQGLLPTGTQLLNEQAGAYEALGNRIDEVCQSMKNQAILNAYTDEYNALIDEYVQAQLLYEEKKAEFESAQAAKSYNMISDWDYSKFETNLYTAELAMYEMEDKVNAFEGKMQTALEKYGVNVEETAGDVLDTVSDTADEVEEIAGDAFSSYNTNQDEDLKEYEYQLNQKVAELDKSLALRKISEEKYYSELKKYLDENANTESLAYYEQLSRYEEYLKKQSDASKKLAEEKQKLAEKNAEEELKAAEKQLEEQKKIVDEGLNDILSQYQKAYDELDKKRQAYRNKLMSVGGDLFSVDVTEENGKKTTTYTVNNLDEQLRKMREYHRQVKALKEQKASEGLLNELTSMGTEDSAQFAKYLSQMSDAEFAKINDLYNKKQELADELAQDLYKSDAQKLADSMTNALADIAGNSADYGKEAADSYIDAFKAEFDERSAELMELFRNTDLAAEVKATVEAEIERYSAAAHTAPAATGGTDQTQAVIGRNYDLEAALEKLNKPVQLVLDGKVIAESVITYQKNYKKQTGG